MLPAIVALVSAVILGGPVARRTPLELERLVDGATFICIGRVTAVIEVHSAEPIAGDRWTRPRSDLPIARVAVERVIKGDARRTFVHHEVWSTWACDDTEARVGQRCLFLLAPGAVAVASEGVQQSVRTALGGDLPLRNVGDGDGILRIETIGDEEILYCSRTPEVLRWNEDRYASRLRDSLAYIETLCAFSRDAVKVHARSEPPSPGSFDLRILDGGRARLARDLGSRERVVTFELSPDAWDALRRELVISTANQVRTVGDAEPWLRRKLTLRFGSGSLNLVEPMTGFAPPASKEELFALQDALRAWGLVRVAIDCAGCDDYAEQDRAWIERR